MTAELNFSNVAVPTTETTLSGTAGTTLTLGVATGWPAAPFRAVLEPGTPNQEVITVGARTTTACSAIVRNADGNGAFTHASGSVIAHEVTGQEFSDPRAILDVYRNAALNMGASGANVLMSWDTITKDTSGSWATGSALVFPVAGTYQINAAIGMPSLVTTAFMLAEWRLNAAGAIGSGTRAILFSSLGQNTVVHMPCTFRVEDVAAGDTLECWVRQSTAATPALTVGSKYGTWARLQYVSR